MNKIFDNESIQELVDKQESYWEEKVFLMNAYSSKHSRTIKVFNTLNVKEKTCIFTVEDSTEESDIFSSSNFDDLVEFLDKMEW